MSRATMPMNMSSSFRRKTDPYVVFLFDRSGIIPESALNDDCFQSFGKKLTVINTASKITILLNDFQHDFQQSVLDAFAQSNFFQNHAKQIESIELGKFWLNHWMPFLKTFAARHEPKLRGLSLAHCHFAPDGARAFAWLLDNQTSGIQIKSLALQSLTGDRLWISAGLSKNTAIKILTAKTLVCGLEFLEFFRQHPSLDQFEKISCDGLHNSVSSPGNDKFWLKIQLGCSDYQRRSSSMYGYDEGHFLKITYHLTSDGTVSLDMDGNGEWEGNLDLHWEAIQNLLTFRKDQHKAFKFFLDNFALANTEPFLRIIAAHNDAPLKELSLRNCRFSIQDAVQLDWLLNTDTSRINVETLRISNLDGSKAWLSGFYQNKSIKSLDLSDLALWHSALHFLLNGNANKLESARFANFVEEKNRGPCCVGNDMLASTINTNANIITTNKARENLSPLNTFSYRCINRNQDHQQIPKSVCESIGSVLRAARVRFLIIEDATIHPGYDFLKDAVSCQEIILKNTDFEPRILASLINNGGGQSKRLSFDRFSQNIAHGEKVVELFKLTDLTLLDGVYIGELMPQSVFRTLCHQFGQNRGPRSFIWFYNQESREDPDFLKKFGTSLTDNTKVEEIELVICSHLEARKVLQFFHLICKMPSLKKLALVGWNPDREQEHVEHDMEECKNFTIEQNLERNIELEWSTGLRSEYEDRTLRSMLKTFWRCKELLSYESNDLPDGLWAHVFVHAMKKSCWEVFRFDLWCMIKTQDLLFFLVRQLPRLFQQAGNRDGVVEEPSFSVPHHPNCPACHKRRKVLNNAP